jgi:hypothetical protein
MEESERELLCYVVLVPPHAGLMSEMDVIFGGTVGPNHLRPLPDLTHG